jgi:hypothetical protein
MDVDHGENEQGLRSPPDKSRVRRIRNIENESYTVRLSDRFVAMTDARTRQIIDKDFEGGVIVVSHDCEFHNASLIS